MVFAGVTVIVALLALNVTGVGFLGLMGTVGAVAVLVAILMAVTLTPALLALVGPRILRRRERARLSAGRDSDDAAITDATSPCAPVARGPSSASAWLPCSSSPRPRSRCGSACPTAPPKPPTRAGFRAYEVQAEKFGDGFNGPLLVVADLPAAIGEEDVVAEQAAIGEELAGLERRGGRADRRLQDATRRWPSRSPADGPPSSIDRELVQNLRKATPATTDGSEATSASPATRAPASTSPTSSPTCCRSTSPWWWASRC